MRSVSGNNFFFYVSTTLEEETWILYRKITLPPLILENFAFSFGKCNRLLLKDKTPKDKHMKRVIVCKCVGAY